MRDPNFDTIPVFNEAVAKILGLLYSQHPVPVQTHPAVLADGIELEDWDMFLNDRQQVYESTVTWLEAEGFIRQGEGGTCDGTTGELTLTFKGLSAVNGIPPMLAQGEMPKPFGELLKEAAKKEATQQLAGLGATLLKTAGYWAWGHLNHS